ncbi:MULTISPECIES: hypothetical protein [unclassified Rhizobium]|uniref:hypothetical protein n=1 Tax=unclassified Rhizobium TaxID=2613769 RepID=UPI0012E339F7|nr:MULTISPECIES: hypothetical protein [unclassified Rhizobium]
MTYAVTRLSNWFEALLLERPQPAVSWRVVRLICDQMNSIVAMKTNAAPTIRTLSELVSPIVCLLALTVRYYVRFVSAESGICAALPHESVDKVTPVSKTFFISIGSDALPKY